MSVFSEELSRTPGFVVELIATVTCRKLWMNAGVFLISIVAAMT